MRPRTVSYAVLCAALVALSVWRAVCVLAGPDIDTDAYAHHMIARAILADPRDLAVHWVWLPLFHYLQVPVVAIGGTMNDVRWANVVLSAILPAAVFAYVQRTEKGPMADGTALFAALLTAACPIAMQMGTTAQPEPLFAVIMFLAAVAFQTRRYGAAAAWLGAGVLLRYEAWASLVAVGAALAVDGPRHRRTSSAVEGSWKAWLVVAVPFALILAWAALRRPVDGRWFGFLGQTRSFATDATHEGSALDRGFTGLVHDAFYYPVLVAARVMGPAIVLVPFGLVRTVRNQGGRFVLVLAACLFFVSFTWVMRSSLGLDRHFVVVVPLYAIFAAQGAVVVGDGAARLGARWASPHVAAVAGRCVSGALAAGALVGIAVALDVWMGFWKASIERGWPEQAAVGAYLRSLPGNAPIFCDEATVEILSGVDRHRFDRHWMDDPETWRYIDESAHEHGIAYVATWNRKLLGHDDAGRVVFRAPADAAPPDGFGVMRVVPDAGRARN